MSIDATSLFIAGVAGCIIGAMVTTAILGHMAARAATRAERAAWTAANIYYTRKGNES